MTLILNYIDEREDLLDGYIEKYEEEEDVAQSSFNSIKQLCYVSVSSYIIIIRYSGY